MTEDAQKWKRKRRRLWLALGLLVVLAAVVLVPPMVSISRYKSRITQLISQSLGRQVHMSAVELQLLPRPGFVLSDLTVDEDPAYGSEPVLRANTVTASIRLLSLWRGRLEINTISVDEASMNVVRTAEGRWNLDSLFRTAAAKTQAGSGAGFGGGTSRTQRAIPLPYLEATNSRINFKRGAEKMPYSLVNTDLSFWQEQPGDWRIRLRGQPARTDLTLDLPDTGVVQLEARVLRAWELRQMPVHLDMEWQEAELGQLARLLIGSDPGWRGDLDGELHLDGTAEAAEVKTRLRAAGVHRAEFAPAAPMDFDATCGFLFHFSARALENLDCNSPLGDGRVHVAGDLPGNGVSPKLTVELDRIPVAAGLDALRTVRSNFAPGLEAKGAVSGKISYAVAVAPADPQPGTIARASSRSGKARAPVPGPLTGSLTVEGFELDEDGLSKPIEIGKVVFEPAVNAAVNPRVAHAMTGQEAAPAALATAVELPAGGVAPLAVTARIAFSGYQVSVHGQAGMARGRELAHVAGLAHASGLDGLAGDPILVDLTAAGPWRPAERAPFADPTQPEPEVESAGGAGRVVASKAVAGAGASPLANDPPSAGDTVSGTVTLHNANWKADYLANHVEIAQAVLHVGGGQLRWDPVEFSYGPVKGMGSLEMAAHCVGPTPCVPQFHVRLGNLDASVVEAAFLGAHEQGTLLSTLIARLRPGSSSAGLAWPALEGTISAGSLVLGPVTLNNATANLHIEDAKAEISDLEAELLGGRAKGSGTLHLAAGEQAKPTYTLEGQFDQLSPAAVGRLVGMDWGGRAFNASGEIEVSGFTDKDLAASVTGTLHFDWQHGAIVGMLAGPGPLNDPSADAADVDAPYSLPAVLARFDRWTGDAAIAKGSITLTDNEVQQGARKRPVEGELAFGNPPRVTLRLPKPVQAAR